MTPSTTSRSAISLRNPVFLRFLVVSAAFIAGMAALLFNHVTSSWVWIGYIAVWWWAENKAAHSIRLGWKGWAVFFAVLIAVDLTVIWLAS